MVDLLIRSLLSEGAFVNLETSRARETLAGMLPKEDKLDLTREAELALLHYENALVKVAFEKGLAAGIEFATTRK